MATMEQPAKPTLELYKQSFREYLRETAVVANEDELSALMTLLHEPLPVSFRLNLHRPEAEHAKTMLAKDLQFPTDTFAHNDTPVNPPKPIAWYPLPHVAWQVDCGRVALSKSAPKHEQVKAFHSWLLQHTDNGTIDRQEAVSMLPVLFLDVQPAHRVLDMCASPGSKTTQVLDFLLAASSDAQGMVVANDLDKKRAYMLVHRLTRNTLRHAVVTCGRGDTFPGLYESGQLQSTNVFDRVLCDVPCSGDGTLRKNQALWKEWHIGQGLTLHPVQLALAMRGAALLKVGGVMVYSTCSFNPIENEAVVGEVLRRAGGALELVDVSKTLPDLVARPGRTSWPVGWRSKSRSTNKGHLFKAAPGAEATSDEEKLHDWFASYDDLPSELRGHRLLRSMFPPTSETDASILENALRLVPTDQNSGGFFIAVLRKTRDLPGDQQQGLEPLEEDVDTTPPSEYVCKLCQGKGHYMKHCTQYVPETEYTPSTDAPPAKKPRTEDAESKPESKKKASGEKPRETLYRRIGDDVWQCIQKFYGIEDATLKDRLWCRSDGAANVNYVDEPTAAACLAGDALEIVNTGLKVFVKVTEKGETYYRPSEESLGFIESFFSTRTLALDLEDLLTLVDAKHHVRFEQLTSAATQETLKTLPVGPAVAHLSSNADVAINVWIGNGAILPRVSKAMRVEVHQALRR